jgi:hypothetical protein
MKDKILKIRNPRGILYSVLLRIRVKNVVRILGIFIHTFDGKA